MTPSTAEIQRELAETQVEMAAVLGRMISEQKTVESILRSLLEDGVTSQTLDEMYGDELDSRFLFVDSACAQAAQYGSEAIESLLCESRDAIYRCLVLVGR